MTLCEVFLPNGFLYGLSFKSSYPRQNQKMNTYFKLIIPYTSWLLPDPTTHKQTI